MVRRGSLLLFGLLLVLASCQTPATDPDAAVRALLPNSWKPDTSVAGNPEGSLLLLREGGTGLINSTHACTWTYTNGTLRIVSSYGTDTTASPAVTSSTLVCQVNGESVAFTTASAP